MIKYAALSYLPTHHPDLEPDDITEALVDHEMPADRHGYLDKSTLRGRELLSGIATELAWRMLTTDQGARRVRDDERYDRALRRHRIIDDELEHLQIGISRLLGDEPRRKDHALQTLLELRALDEQRDQLKTRLHALDQEIEQLRHDPTTQIPAPDDIPDDKLHDTFDQIERTINGGISKAPTNAGLPAPVRNPPWITIPEAAEILEVSYPQIARWANGQHLPFRSGDPRNPWQPDAIPIDTTQGPRRRRIATDHVNPAYIHTEGQRRRLAETIARWPAGWNQAQRTAPLQITVTPSQPV